MSADTSVKKGQTDYKAKHGTSEEPSSTFSTSVGDCNDFEDHDVDDEEAVDITEDDVNADDDKGSDTDSGSYWSAIDEEDEQELGELGEQVKEGEQVEQGYYSQCSYAAHESDSFVSTEDVHKAVIMRLESTVSDDREQVVLLRNGDITADDRSMDVEGSKVVKSNSPHIISYGAASVKFKGSVTKDGDNANHSSETRKSEIQESDIPDIMKEDDVQLSAEQEESKRSPQAYSSQTANLVEGSEIKQVKIVYLNEDKISSTVEAKKNVDKEGSVLEHSEIEQMEKACLEEYDDVSSPAKNGRKKTNDNQFEEAEIDVIEMDEAKKLARAEKKTMSLRGSRKMSPLKEDLTFQIIHSHIAENLQLKTGSSGFNVSENSHSKTRAFSEFDVLENSEVEVKSNNEIQTEEIIHAKTASDFQNENLEVDNTDSSAIAQKVAKESQNNSESLEVNTHKRRIIRQTTKKRQKIGKNGLQMENLKGDNTNKSRMVQQAFKEDQGVEETLDSYDLIDQFDVKISEKENSGLPLVANVGKIRAFTSGVRRTLSMRVTRKDERELSEAEDSRRSKSDTWATRDVGLPSDDFVDVKYSKREVQGEEIVEILVVTPKANRKAMTNDDSAASAPGTRSWNDAQDVTDGTAKYGMLDPDIGSAEDLIDGPQNVKLTKFKKLNDDIDIISLSGMDSNERKSMGIDDYKVQSPKTSATIEDGPGEDATDDVFDENRPLRPPRRKKMQGNTSPPKPNPPAMRRGSSESDIRRGSQKSENRSTSSYDLRILPAIGQIESKSDENLFKGVMPFFDDSKKKTLSGPSTKNIPPNKEELKLFTDAFPPCIPDFPQDRRSLIAHEVYTTERSFVRGLELLVQLFKKKALQLGHLDNKEVETVFSNVDTILDFNKGILDEVYQRISNWSDDQEIADVFMQNASKFRIYAPYCQNYDASELFIKQKMKKKKDFEAFLQSCCRNPACQIGLTLPSYLITVVQRTPRYILLLKDLLKRTPNSHPDFKNLTIAVTEMEKIAEYINNQLRLSQSEKALAALEQQIVGLKAYYFSGRTLVHEGPVCLMNIKRTCQCVLFNDLLVFASKGDSKQSEVELVLDLSVVWLQDLEDLDPQSTKEDAIGLFTPDRPYTIYVGTKGEKKLWTQHITKAIKAHIYGDEAKEDSKLYTSKLFTDLDILLTMKQGKAKRTATHTYKNGAVYNGQFIDSKRDGEGTMMWPNQMTYRGQWTDDERNGRGILEYGTGETYDGEWKNDKLHGYGSCKYSNGDEIHCQWKIGIRHGMATLNFANGDVFEGTFKSDRIEGEGKLVCKNGLEYDGSWRRNMKYGIGTLKMQNGDVYKGSFKNDNFSGDGELIYACGAIYRGEFDEGQRNGCGSYTTTNGYFYVGHWLRDLKDGTGTLTFPNGDVYEGSFLDGKRCGTGKITYHKGGCYDGHWEDDIISGQGTMEYLDGSKYEGNWDKGQRSGKGKLTQSDGSLYEGEWQHDMFHGRGTLEKPSEWKYKGNWVHGKRHGNGTLTDPTNSYKFQGVWKNDKKEGKGLEMTHCVLYDGDFKNDKRDGRGIETAQDTTTYEGHWRLGQKHGKGARKLLNGMVQPQVWAMGCLMECPVVVAREVPPLQRS